jgi:hypothetical protein
LKELKNGKISFKYRDDNWKNIIIVNYAENKMKKSGIKTPVLLIFFSRPDTFRLVFNEVKKARPAKLFLACDGPRDSVDNDIHAIKECRNIAEDIDWECEVYKNYLDTNVGCGTMPYTSIKWALNYVDRLIILEDDCVPNFSFFGFMEDALEQYINDTRIGMVSGTNHFFEWNCGLNSYCFTKTGAIWGWGTWARVWEKYSFGVKGIESKYLKELLFKEINLKQIAKKRIKKWENINKDVSKGKSITYWDYQFGYLKYTQSYLTIVPKYNLITNIGIGEDSTHAKNTLKMKWKLGEMFFIPTKEIEFPIRHPEAIICDRKYDEKYYKEIGNPNILYRIKRKILKLLDTVLVNN